MTRKAIPKVFLWTQMLCKVPHCQWNENNGNWNEKILWWVRMAGKKEENYHKQLFWNLKSNIKILFLFLRILITEFDLWENGLSQHLQQRMISFDILNFNILFSQTNFPFRRRVNQSSKRKNPRIFHSPSVRVKNSSNPLCGSLSP